MILICVMGLEAFALEFNPFATFVFVIPFDLVQDVRWHAQHTCCTDVTMMIRFEHGIVTDNSIFKNKGCLVRQGHVPLGVISIHDVSTASILERFGFLPVHQVVVIGTVMAVMLKISGAVMTDKGVAIIDMVNERSRKSTSFSIRVKGTTQRLIGIVSIASSGLICFFWVIGSESVTKRTKRLR